MLDFVLITGLSGAGKSQALAVFEDAGYFCVDNLPTAMISALADLFQHEGSNIQRVAVVSDARGGAYFEGMAQVLDALRRSGVPHRVLFLDALDDVLMNRFKETRRRHPLAAGGHLAAGIRAERALLEPLRARADVRIDTSDLSAARFRQVVAERMLPGESAGKLGMTFISFGFKHGGLREGDLTFDVRFLPNPHYVPELRPLTGLDAPVREFVNGSPGLEEFYGHLLPMLDYLLPAYVREGKSHLTIGVGCTGGRHRSVVISEHLAKIYGDRSEYRVEVLHRDADKPPER